MSQGVMRGKPLQKRCDMMQQTTTQVIAKCPHCGSKNVYGMSRVVGYFSRIDNWNSSKRAEFKDRQKGRYKL